jgi:hypothetical protein
MLRQLLALGLLLIVAAAPRAAEPAKITAAFANDKDGKPLAIVIAGLDDAVLKACRARDAKAPDWEKGARVQLAGGSAEELAQRPALLGAWSVRDDKLRFEPRFPFLRASELRVTVDPARLADPQSSVSRPAVFDLRIIAKNRAPATKVEAIYPTSKLLPENQLRFYIHFSAPMSRGEAYEQIKLLDAKGKPVNDVFLELSEELWSESMQRFTLLFHPGRVKKGLKPREELGPILENGKSYALVISGQWRDGEGRPLVDKEYRKDFSAGPPVEEAVDPKQWQLRAPLAGTKDAFQVKFPRPLDHALLQRVLSVVNEQGKKVRGTIAVSEEETLWKFTPEQIWQPGAYRLVAETILEDLAANRIGRPFEVDIFRPIPKTVQTESVELPFAVNKGK